MKIFAQRFCVHFLVINVIGDITSRRKCGSWECRGIRITTRTGRLSAVPTTTSMPRIGGASPKSFSWTDKSSTRNRPSRWIKIISNFSLSPLSPLPVIFFSKRHRRHRHHPLFGYLLLICSPSLPSFNINFSSAKCFFLRLKLPYDYKALKLSLRKRDRTPRNLFSFEHSPQFFATVKTSDDDDGNGWILRWKHL